MKTIYSTKGVPILVDDEDYEALKDRKWLVDAKGYAICEGGTVDGKRYRPKMHRLIMGLKPGDEREVDHRNRIRLDNQRANLRVCTSGENSRNIGISPHNKTGFKGVSWHKATGKWQAQIGTGKKGSRGYLGVFNTPEEAYAAYCRAASEFHGEFASLGEEV